MPPHAARPIVHRAAYYGLSSLEMELPLTGWEVKGLGKEPAPVLCKESGMRVRRSSTFPRLLSTVEDYIATSPGMVKCMWAAPSKCRDTLPTMKSGIGMCLLCTRPLA